MVDSGATASDESVAERAALDVRNIGGIERCSVAFERGTTVLTGHNATNRTSLLRAINGVLGGSSAALKSNADEGRVSLTIGEETFTRTYERTGAGVTVDGSPYESNADLVDLFVTLLEDNPARRAVERGDDLRDLIMRPVDTVSIQERIRSLQSERDELEAERERVERRYEKLPELEERRERLTAEIESTDDEIESLRETVVQFEADADMAERAEELVDELDERRQELNDVTDQIDLVSAEIEALEDEPEELRDERSEIESYDQADLEAVQEKLQTARNRRREVEATVTDLSAIVEFNEDLLSEDASRLPGIDTEQADPAAELAPADHQEVTCWTCGNRAERGAIADRLDNLRDVIAEKRDERAELEDRIDSLETELEEIRDAIERRSALERELETVEDKLASKRDRLETLEARADELRETIAELESAVANTEELRDSELLDAYERISDLQYEQGQTRQELASVEEEIEAIESLPSKESLQEQLDSIRDELDRERGRISEIESDAVSAFNDHMAEILDVLGYENVSRVWIERKDASGGGGEPSTTFELHVVRESETGTMYEDTVDHLSESEREVIGLVVALAGYLVHEVYREVPFVLLDSLEAIDADRIAGLVEYFSEYAPYLVVALLPEDAAGISEVFDTIPASELN